MNSKAKWGGSVLLAVVTLLASTPSAHAYGPEGLFGGRPQPDSSISLGNPVEIKNDRPERAESVLEHPRPDYDPVPVDIGSFELYPTLELGSAIDSNLYVTPNDERTDAIGTIRPIVNLFSDWSRHALAVTVFGDSNYYSQRPDENYNNMVFDTNGRYDIAADTWVAARGGYQRLAETRTSINASNGEVPTTLGYGKLGTSFYRGVGAVKLSVDYDYSRFDYDDTPADGGVIDGSVRNRNEHKAMGKVGYQVSGNLKPYVRGSYNVRNYDHNDARNSDGYETVAGVEADFGGITSVDVFAGWMEQYYDDFTGGKKDLSSPRIGGRVDWNVTGKTSVVLEADRTVEETVLPEYNSYYQTGGSVTVTHELLRNVLLEGDLGYSHYDFNGTGDREDDGFFSGVGARYLINRSLYTDLFYNYERRYSTDDTAEFDRNTVMWRVGVHL
ncbi:MAG: outer membrane beta-barrel protein [Alphaproteobacteria bacterium]|nr:outer membrane beta-barrel protein [Alphaproteobacteria bacterium]